MFSGLNVFFLHFDGFSARLLFENQLLTVFNSESNVSLMCSNFLLAKYNWLSSAYEHAYDHIDCFC